MFGAQSRDVAPVGLAQRFAGQQVGGNGGPQKSVCETEGHTEKAGQPGLRCATPHVVPVEVAVCDDPIQVDDATQLRHAVLLALAHGVEQRVFEGGDAQGRASRGFQLHGPGLKQPSIQLDGVTRAGEAPVHFDEEAAGVSHAIVMMVFQKPLTGSVGILALVPERREGVENALDLRRIHENVEIAHDTLDGAEDLSPQRAPFEHEWAQISPAESGQDAVLFEVPEHRLLPQEGEARRDGLAPILKPFDVPAQVVQPAEHEPLDRVPHRLGREPLEDPGCSNKSGDFLPGGVPPTQLDQKPLGRGRCGSRHGRV